MAHVILAEPGTELGPCSKPCEHSDCDRARLIAASTCPGCPNPIGYERAFAYAPDGSELEHGPWHLLCLTYAMDFAGADRPKWGFS